MFRRKLLFVLALVLVLGFVSCDNGTTKETFYFALYQINQATFDNMNFNLTPTDALDWVRRQPGTGSAPEISRSGYSMKEMDDFLRGYFVGFSNDSFTRISTAMQNYGYYYSKLTGGSSGYAFLYINKE